jgi:hypothetical protein
VVVVAVDLDVVVLVVVVIVVSGFSSVKIENFKIRARVTTRIIKTMKDMPMILIHL